jgi:hypothetical protein
MRKSFSFEGDGAGYFETWPWPASDGLYRYQPLRTLAHVRMHERRRATGSARCHYERKGQKIWFTVVGAPKVGLLKLADFEDSEGKPKT